MKREEKTIAKNKKAFHEYEILETLEAGIELTGTEVRSLRDNHCQLTALFRRRRKWYGRRFRGIAMGLSASSRRR